MQPKSLASIFLSDKLAGQPGTPNSPQTSSSSLPALPGDVRLLFPASRSPSEALRSHTPKVLQRPVGHIPPGITSIPSRREGREMQAKRDGQAVGREEQGGGGGRS